MNNFANFNNAKLIKANDKNISFMGRVDWSGQAPKIVFAGTSITINFIGTRLDAVIYNHRFYNEMSLGVVIDGRVEKVCFNKNDEKFNLTLAENLENTKHTVTLFKRQDATHYFDFFGFLLESDAQVLPASREPARRIECYGDSVSAGAVCEALDYVSQLDPVGHEGKWDNAWYSYSMITARNLGAQLNNVAQGGIAIFNGTGYYYAPKFIGMETVYDKICYFPDAEGGFSNWNFSNYTPHLVIFAVGQNDSHHEGFADVDITNADYREKWKKAYKDIICNLRGKYPNATFVMILTVLVHSSDWDKAVGEIVEELKCEGDSKISHFMFTRTGKATPGHPRISEQYEMATELTAYISQMGDKVWED